MKAIIMAAGKGCRISNEIGEVPKSTLIINEKSIIRNTVEIFILLGIEPIVCTGYKSENIKEALAGLKVRYYHNPFYDITNNIVSLWFAKEELNDDVIILSADVVFEKKIVEILMVQDNPLTMTVDSSRTLDGDFFFKLSDEGHILEYGPDLPENIRSCESLGLSKVRSNAIEVFSARLNEMIDEGKHALNFERIFHSFNDDQIYRNRTVDVNGCIWREIDFYHDYVKAKKQFEVI
ncbi:MAG: phosphocholine cytidylyltransferase family protein [Lachnospiraceae bacterium]|nr:phosphocholine cytidylyltransferase family protein [Lachnospiraceae bacterium]